MKSISTTTTSSTTSDKPKPFTSSSSSTDQPSNSKYSSKSKPTKPAQQSVSVKPAKLLKKQSQPYSKKRERQKKTNPILLNRFRALESMDAIDDISDDQYETDLDPPHSPRPPDN